MPNPVDDSVRFPRQGWGVLARRPEQVLLLCWYDPSGISTVPETVALMQAGSGFSVTVLNLCEHRADTGYLRLNPLVRLDAFDAVVIHNSVAYDVDNLRALDKGLGVSLRQFRGAKVLLKQDENHRFRELAAWIGETGIDWVFTCLPPEAVPLVYPPEVVGDVRFERMLTGYVTPTLRAQWQPGRERPIDIGYRGSIQPLSFGRLAYEKRSIGAQVSTLLQGRGLALDISSRWEDRIGGPRWFEFLGSCKATLGAESGASIFDLDGDLQQRIATLERQHAGIQDEDERAECILEGLAGLESNVRYHQVSPRHFEAAACGTVQLLYPGDYSGLFQAGRHYFELARDGSNLDEAVALVMDEPRRAEMAQRAFDEVVMNPANWLEGFVGRVDLRIRETLQRKGMLRQPLARAAEGTNVLLLAAHDPVADPRLGWIEECAPPPLRVHQVGVLRDTNLPPPKVETTERGNLRLAFGRRRVAAADWDPWFTRVSHSPPAVAALHELQSLARAVNLDERAFALRFGAPAGSPRNAQFRWYLQYFLDITATLLENAGRTSGLHAIIATDLDTLPAALILKGLYGVPVHYDAHEYWPETDTEFLESERQFWHGLERRLSPLADFRSTVSPGLARVMGQQYGAAFDAIPNCEPANRVLPVRAGTSPAHQGCRFLFQGNFAKGRGLDLLIRAWPSTHPDAILQLRGPESDYKQEMLALAAATGLVGTRILFPPPVPEDQLVPEAAHSDVGLIPYTPAGTAYRHCCPNKMSQYMAAGLPVLANHTEFVAQTVEAAGCGLVLDFATPGALVAAVDRFCTDAQARTLWGSRAREYFVSRFNWDIAAQPLYAELAQLTAGAPPASFEVFPGVPRNYLEAPVEPQVLLAAPLRPILADLGKALWWRLPEAVRVLARPALNIARKRTPDPR